MSADLASFRADQVGDPQIGHPTIANPLPGTVYWFDPSAFTAPQGVGRNGLVHHNAFRGPGYVDFDLSLGKVFTLVEGKTLEFKWENYNALNHVNLANPNGTVDVSGGGGITAASTMRQMQFGLHFRF